MDIDIDDNIQWTKTALAKVEVELSQLKIMYNIVDVSLLRKRDELAEKLAEKIRIRSMLDDYLSQHSA